jgi:chromosome segregation ATPase
MLYRMRSSPGPRSSAAASRSSLWAYLDIEIDRIVELRSDCSIVARGLLLGGGGKLVIKDPGHRGAALSDGAVIDGASSGSVDEAIETLNAELDPRNPAGLLMSIKAQLDSADVNSILGKVHSSLNDLNAVTHSLARQLQPNERDALLSKVHAALDNINATTRELREQVRAEADGMLLAKVHSALDAVNHSLLEVSGVVEENRPTIRETLLAVQQTADTVEHRIAEPIASELDLANARSLLNRLHSSFEKINTSLADFEVISERAKTVVVLNEDRLNQLMLNLNETAVHLKSAGKDLRRNPWRLFYRPSLEETKQLNIFDAAREFAEAASRLDDSATQLSALMKSHDGTVPADDPDLAKIRERLKQTFEDYTRAEEALWKQLDVR